MLVLPSSVSVTVQTDPAGDVAVGLGRVPVAPILMVKSGVKAVVSQTVWIVMAPLVAPACGPVIVFCTTSDPAASKSAGGVDGRRQGGRLGKDQLLRQGSATVYT